MNKKSLPTLLVVLLLAVLAYFGNNQLKSNPAPTNQPTEAALTAIVLPTAASTKAPQASAVPAKEKAAIDKNGEYDSKDEVALYLHTYGSLPSNFITKQKARDLGWTGGTLKTLAPGKSIGGDRFGNYEGILPDKKGRTYYECDIDTLGKSSRGAKRIVYSNDGLIYYTDDHYESFILLYGDE